MSLFKNHCYIIPIESRNLWDHHTSYMGFIITNVTSETDAGNHEPIIIFIRHIWKYIHEFLRITIFVCDFENIWNTCKTFHGQNFHCLSNDIMNSVQQLHFVSRFIKILSSIFYQRACIIHLHRTFFYESFARILFYTYRSFGILR